ncbi:PilZ domain-containing protein [Stutzerimonas tarimensis]|uniref:PilZ domain-containing protein n=1 Tax=Stutzerimonas tarimensis TaxID=1507735 RepID=A0ABV7T1G9_9GAMM
MSNQRRIERHQLPYYLKVFNRNTDKPLGFIGNISEQGLMLISPYPMLLHARFEMRLKIPAKDGSVHYVDLQATCQWTREDVTPGSYDSGFKLIEPPEDIREMVDALQQYFSFQPFQASPEPRGPGLNDCR